MEYLQTQGISLPRLGLRHLRMQGDACRAGGRERAHPRLPAYRHRRRCMAMKRPSARRSPHQAFARGDLHVTTKVWNENLAPDAIRRSFETS